MDPPPYPGEANQGPGYNAPYPSQGYPQNPGYPPQAAVYSAVQPGFNPGYPQQQPGYPQQQQPFPPLQQPGYPQQQPGYPQQQPGPGYIATSNQGLFKGMMSGAQNDSLPSEGDNAAGLTGFSDKAIRRGFIRKVYGILMCQLVLTGGIIAIFITVEPVQTYVQRNIWIFYAALVATIVCIISMVCCTNVRRKAPTNFIFLAIFTACEGILLGVVTSKYRTDAVLIAVGATAAVVLALTLFAFQTKWDFTTCGGMLLVVLVVFVVAGFLMSFMAVGRYAIIGYGSAGAIIFGLYIVYDTQLMMGGSHKYSLSPEEYIFASLNLYLDIINLFMYILMIVGAARGD